MTIAVALFCDDCGVEDVRDRGSGGGQALRWCLSKVLNSSPLMATRLQNGGRAPRSVELQPHRAAWSCSPTYRKGDWRRQPPAALPRNYLFSAALWAPSMNVQCEFHTVTILETRCTQDAGADESKRGEGRREPIHQQTRVLRSSQNICLL